MNIKLIVIMVFFMSFVIGYGVNQHPLWLFFIGFFLGLIVNNSGLKSTLLTGDSK